MNGLRALARSACSLPAYHPQARAVQILLNTCWSPQQSGTLRSFSAKGGDDENSGTGANPRGSWRSWVEQQLSGIDQAMLSDEQKAAERQLNEQKPQEQAQAAAQQSAQTAGQAETATQTAEEQLQAQADATSEQIQQSAQTADQEEASTQTAEDQLQAEPDATSEQTQQSAQTADQEEASTQTAEDQLQAEPDATSEQIQQSAQTAGQEEAAELRAEEQLDAQSDLTSEQAASPQAASASDQAPSPESDTEAEVAEAALSQPSQLAQEHAAEPQEPQQAPTTLTTAADETIPAHAESQLSDLPAAERLQILLEAIRNRTWEQTEEEKASAEKLQDDSLTLPASGYSEIGAISQGRFQGQMLNPERTFYPGQSYHPEDLVPQAVDRQNQPRKHQNRIPSTMKAYSNKEVHRLADFRNLPVLNEFVSEGGQIVSRQKSKLQSKVHRHLARQIKTARVMALLPHAGRAPQFDTNAAFDVTDDDFAIDGTFDIETFVRQEAQDRRVAREGETTDPRMFDD